MKNLFLLLLFLVNTNILHSQVPNYVPSNGLVAWWPFTGNALDSSGNVNNGIVYGATLNTIQFANKNHYSIAKSNYNVFYYRRDISTGSIVSQTN
jgi:hypothetical protein